MAKNAKRPVYLEFQPEKVQRSPKESNIETTETEKSTSTKIGKQIATTTLRTKKVIQSSVIRPTLKKELLPPPKKESPLLPAKKESLLTAKKESLITAKKERYIELKPQEKSNRQEKYVGKKPTLLVPYVDPETEKEKEKDLKTNKSKREDYLLAQTQKEKLSKIEDYLLARTQLQKNINTKEDYLLAQSTRMENNKNGKKTAVSVGTHGGEPVPEHYIKAFAGALTKSDRSHEVSLKSDRESPGPDGSIPSGLSQMKDLISDTSKTVTEKKVVVTSAPPVPKMSPSSSDKSPPAEQLTPVVLKPSVKKPATKRCSLKVKLIIGFVLFIVVTIIFVCIIILVVTQESEEKNGSSTTRQSTTQTDKRL